MWVMAGGKSVNDELAKRAYVENPPSGHGDAVAHQPCETGSFATNDGPSLEGLLATVCFERP